MKISEFSSIVHWDLCSGIDAEKLKKVEIRRRDSQYNQILLAFFEYQGSERKNQIEYFAIE